MMAGIEAALGRAAGRAVLWVGTRAAEAKREADARELSRPLLTGGQADRIIEELTPAQLKGLVDYLNSPDFEQIAVQLVYLWSSSSRREGLQAAVREELHAGLRHFVGVPPEQLLGITDVVLAALHEAGFRAGSSLVGAQLDAAVVGHVVAMAAGNGRLLERVDQLASFHDVALRLRTQVAALYGEIRLPHTGVNRSVRWEQLYVTPTLRAVRNHYPDPDPDQFIWPGQRTVILGDPGAGKSTLACKLAYDIATDTDSHRANLVPFLVVLRDLSTTLEHGQRSLVDHLTSVCRDPYHVDASIDAIEYLLLNGRAVVILDGLDELTEVSLRTRVIRLVEGFVTAYPLVPIVATSRRVGYMDAPLPAALFHTCLIASFDTSQVEAYTGKWFALDEGTPANARERLGAAFLRESRSIEDLRSNPLLLSLLCAMYSTEHFLPRNRAQIYERCALMVFERWDSMRGVRMPLQFQGHVRAAVQRLAWHLLTEETSSELPRGRVLRLLVDFLIGKRYDEDEAARMAEEFLAFCAGRAWVLAEVGVAGAEPIYGFAHRTFLEFFAAEYLVRHYPLPEQVWGVLGPQVDVSSWEVVGQLVLQLLDRNLEDGADLLLTHMLNALPEAGAKRRAGITAFVSRALGHVTPSPALVSRIIDAVVDQALGLSMAERIKHWVDQDAFLRWNMADGPLYAVLHLSLDANVQYVRRALISRLGAEAEADNDVALLLAGNLSRAGSGDDRERAALWAEASAEIAQAQDDAFTRWRERSPWLWLQQCLADPDCTDVVCDRFGPAPFYQSELAVLGASYPMAMELLSKGGPNGEPIDLSRGPQSPAAHRLRDALLRHPTPWIRALNSSRPSYQALWALDRVRRPPRWPRKGDDLATFVILYLPYLEQCESVESTLVPSGHGLCTALIAARISAARAAALSVRAKAAAATAAAANTKAHTEAAKAAAQAEAKQAAVAQAAAAEANAAVEIAELPAQFAEFLLGWARNEINVIERPTGADTLQ